MLDTENTELLNTVGFVAGKQITVISTHSESKLTYRASNRSHYEFLCKAVCAFMPIMMFCMFSSDLYGFAIASILKVHFKKLTLIPPALVTSAPML